MKIKEKTFSNERKKYNGKLICKKKKVSKYNEFINTTADSFVRSF